MHILGRLGISILVAFFKPIVGTKIFKYFEFGCVSEEMGRALEPTVLVSMKLLEM